MKKEAIDHYYFGDYKFIKDHFNKYTFCRRNMRINVGICEADSTRADPGNKAYCVIFNSKEPFKFVECRRYSDALLHGTDIIINNYDQETIKTIQTPNNLFADAVESDESSYSIFSFIGIEGVAKILKQHLPIALDCMETPIFCARYTLYSQIWRNDHVNIYLMPELLLHAVNGFGRNKNRQLVLNPYLPMSNAGKAIIRE